MTYPRVRAYNVIKQLLQPQRSSPATHASQEPRPLAPHALSKLIFTLALLEANACSHVQMAGIQTALLTNALNAINIQRLPPRRTHVYSVTVLPPIIVRPVERALS